MTKLLNQANENGVCLEPGGWIRVRHQTMELHSTDARDLLVLTAELPGNLRYVRAAEGVFLEGELPADSDVAELAMGFARIESWLHDSSDCSSPPLPPPDETLEAILTESVPNYTQREGAWAVACDGGELIVRSMPGGARVEATLALVDEANEQGRRALAEFLVRAQGGLRFVRAELDGQSARIVSHSETEFIDVELPHSLAATAAGLRRLSGEARALLQEELAQAYLDILGGGGPS